MTFRELRNLLDHDPSDQGSESGKKREERLPRNRGDLYVALGPAAPSGTGAKLLDDERGDH